MKALFVAALGIALLIGLVLLPAMTHGPLAVVVFVFARFVDRQATATFGRRAITRWLLAMLVLVAVGAWLGPRDAMLLGVRVSKLGGLAGVTMAARAVGLLIVTSAITRSIVPTKLLARLRRTRARSLAASIVVALRLAPELATMVRAHAVGLRSTMPGAMRAPARWFEVLVLAVAHASTLADDVALDFGSEREEGERRL